MNTSGATAYVKIEYSLDGGSNWTTKSANETVANGSGSLITQAVGDGSAITWRVTSSDTSNNFTGLTPTALSASATVDCPQSVEVTSSQSLGSCSGGSATSTLSVVSTSGTAYVKVEYSLDGGSNWTILSGTLSVNVPHGSAIIWRFTSSDTNGDWTGLTPTTLSASATVDCPVIDVSGAQALSGSCSGGAKTSTLTLSLIHI